MAIPSVSSRLPFQLFNSSTTPTQFLSLTLLVMGIIKGLYHVVKSCQYQFSLPFFLQPKTVTCLALLGEAKENETRKEHLLNESRLLLGFCTDADDIYRDLALEYAKVNPERACEVAKQIHFLNTTCEVADAIVKHHGDTFNCLGLYGHIFQELSKGNQAYSDRYTIKNVLRCAEAFHRLKRDDLATQALDYAVKIANLIENEQVQTSMLCAIAMCYHTIDNKTLAQTFVDKAFTVGAKWTREKLILARMTIAKTCFQLKLYTDMDHALNNVADCSKITNINPVILDLVPLLQQISETKAVNSGFRFPKESLHKSVEDQFHFRLTFPPPPAADMEDRLGQYLTMAQAYQLLGNQKEVETVVKIMEINIPSLPPERKPFWLIELAALCNETNYMPEAEKCYATFPLGKKKLELGEAILSQYNAWNFSNDSKRFFKIYLADLQKDKNETALKKIETLTHLVRSSEKLFALWQNKALLKAAEKLLLEIPEPSYAATLYSIAQRYLQISQSENIRLLLTYGATQARQHFAIASIYALALGVGYLFPVARLPSLVGAVAINYWATRE
jgi:hypothetical protein